MEHQLAWTPDDIDIERPSVARMYDYFLGGSHNFASDRDLAQQAQAIFPDAPYVVRANRSFLGRAVAALCALGVEQFLDLGSGIPTVGNVHEIVAEHRPGARTVYVDSDPVVITHASALLRNTDHVAVVHADLRNPEAVLRQAVRSGGLDLSLPVAVLLVSVLPFVPEEDDPAGIVAAYRDATVPGSFLAISHGTNEYRAKQVGEVETVYARTTQPGVFRGKAEVERFFAGYTLLEPGLVDVIHWRPDPEALQADPLGGDTARYSLIAGVGRRPA
jgi:O-methyltransferase involved in polyketide biosynthesis